MGKNPDFRGLATKSNIRCSDGRTIMPGAFKHHNGAKVPLVWMHGHDSPTNVIGHCFLECGDDGNVWANGYLNDTPNGVQAKAIIGHGDVDALSIFANNLREIGGRVEHGMIREVSLVIAGANPGAVITDIIQHSDGGATVLGDDEAIMYVNEEGCFIAHMESPADDEDDPEPGTVAYVLKHMSEEKRAAIATLLAVASSDDPGADSDDDEPAEGSKSGKTIQEVFASMTEEERDAANYVIGTVLSQDVDTAKHSDIEEENNMKKNAFADTGVLSGAPVLSEEIVHSIFTRAKQLGSLRDAFNEAVAAHKDDEAVSGALSHSAMYGGALAHAEYGYGVSNVGELFPDYANATRTPIFIDRNQGWVQDVMSAVHHHPMARFRSLFADITADQARAKGYITGNLKKEEVFTLLKRQTGPTTVYKKQKLDRDNIIDVKDFDLVAWIKLEMRGKLDEELARAFLIGDGREADDDDKIKEDCIRPIWKDDTKLFVINAVISGTMTEDERAKAVIRAAIKSRAQYEGSGNPTMFTTEEELSNMLLLTDDIGRDLYASEAQLATKVRAKKIVTVPVMNNQRRTVDGRTRELLAIIVNLNDYYVGADKGGSIHMFEDFDIDYNQEKFLIETRCSGALVRPRSAIVIERDVTAE